MAYFKRWNIDLFRQKAFNKRAINTTIHPAA